MGKRVLVADDSATIQKAFSMVLGGQDGISLVPARSFDEAVAAARQGRPDLVIADIVLGNRTGYELCSALKSDPALRGVPVYILASNQTPYDDGRGRQAGADGHLLKPFESQSLVDKIQDALSRPATAGVAVPRPASSSPPVAAAAPPVGARPMVASVPDDLEDEYGEFTIERSSGSGHAIPAAATSGGAAMATAAPPAAAPAPPAPRPSAHPQPTPPFAPATAQPSASTGSTMGSGASLRPSLIPGARPGATARPQVSVTSASSAPPTAAAQRPVSPPSLPRRNDALADGGFQAKRADQPLPDPGFLPRRPEPLVEAGAAASAGHANIGRTIMGLPAVAIPGMPGSPREARPVPAMVPAVPAAPPAAPPALREARPAAPAPAPVPAAPVAPVVPGTPAITPIGGGRQAAAGSLPLAPVPAVDTAALVSARIDQKVAAIAARGPEFEALAKLSREVIEQVVWEVVPELAEIIIREHVERLANARK
jgi:CheY-like chemotaxis protein